MDGLESEVDASGRSYAGTGEQLLGIDVQEGERFIKEMMHGKSRVSGSEDILQMGYEFDELMRDTYAERNYGSGLFKTIKVFYMRLSNKGAKDILKLCSDSFDRSIRDYGAELDRLEGKCDDAYARIEDIHSEMAEQAEEAKRVEKNLMYIRNKRDEIERLISAKREGNDTRGRLSLTYLSDDYHDHRLDSLSRQASELSVLERRAKGKLKPLYARIISLNSRYDDAEQNASLLEAQTRQVSEDLSEIEKNKDEVNEGLIGIIDDQMRIARLAERAGKSVNMNIEVATAAREYLARRFYVPFSSMALNVEKSGRAARARDGLDSRVKDYCEKSQVESEDDRTNAMSVLYKRGII